MKKTFIIIIFILIAYARKVNAQTTGVPDTLAYLQSFAANKSQYIGHPFSKLMDRLTLPIYD